MSQFVVCKPFFSEAGCRAGASCRLRHDAFECSCGALVLDLSKRSHLRGKKHLKWQQAARSNASVAPSAQPSSIPVPEEDRTEKCNLCKQIVFAVQMEAHRAEHERQERLQKMKEELAKAEEDKEGVAVDWKEGINCGVIEAGTAQGKNINIRRTEARGSVRLVRCSMRLALNGNSTSPFSATTGRGNITVRKPRSVVLVFAPSYGGRYEDTLEMYFAHSSGTQFVITRRVHGIAGSREDQEVLKPKGPYKRKRYMPLNIGGPLIPSSRPPTWSGIKWINRLLPYDPPDALIAAAFQRSAAAALRAVKRLMPVKLNMETYGAWFQALLYIEGEQKQRDLDRLFAQKGVELTHHNERYNLEIEGVANGRPSVLVGDYIHAQRSGDAQDTAWYQGRVHTVIHDLLSLYFSDRFSNYRGSKYDIRFIYNRVPERRKHQAVTDSYKPMRALFPDKIHIGYERVTRAEVEAVNPVNRDINENYQQRETLAAILKQPPGSVPFVIFGPPGTGKTVTTVEAMRQLLLKPEVRILACAPSNTAADLIAEKLTVLGKTQLFRLNSLSRRPEDLKGSLESFSLKNNNNIFAFPLVEELRKYRVIVSTCVSAGVLWSIGIRKGHFTHIFVDEAGQGQEPEVMIPFLTLANDSTNFILAGDHQQLGPEVNSHIARSYGLQKSYLSRLMAREIYDVEFGRGLTVVKLLDNYRSHPSILDFSNRHFYRSELRTRGDPVMTHSLEDIDDLPKKRFPIIFHGIVGKDQREESSPSFFNPDEATIVKNYCQSLMSNRKKRIRPEYIGVITPYHSQKCKIQQLLSRDKKLEGIKVGSVDEFQGQERRIIILSTVRSTLDHVSLDMRRSLGFVASPLRLNVAMTRAQALLIVVGNPIVLSLDPLWRSFLNYVHEQGGWKGTRLTWDPREPVNLSIYGNYDSQYRQRAEAELDDTIKRLRAVVSQNLEQYDIDFGADDDNDSDGEHVAVERVRNRDAE